MRINRHGYQSSKSEPKTLADAFHSQQDCRSSTAQSIQRTNLPSDMGDCLRLRSSTVIQAIEGLGTHGCYSVTYEVLRATLLAISFDPRSAAVAFFIRR
eukprot:SAG31_NODE_1065_length_10096_cov_7.151530_9_plen_99_part_00